METYNLYNSYIAKKVFCACIRWYFWKRLILQNCNGDTSFSFTRHVTYTESGDEALHVWAKEEEDETEIFLSILVVLQWY